MFGDLVAMDEESRGRNVTNLIHTLSPKFGVQILPADVRVATRRPPKHAADDPTGPSGTRLPTTTGSVIVRLARRERDASVLQIQWIGEGTSILDRQGRRCSTRLLGAPHLDDIERPVHQAVWLRSPSFRGLTEANMWQHLAEGLLLPAYDQPQPGEAAVDQSAETPAGAGAAWAEYQADTDADDAVICPPTRTLLALLEVRELWKARRSADSLAKTIAADISQRINTPPELQHAQWLTDTMMVAGVEMQQHHTEPTLLRVGDDNLCAISLGKEDEELADTLRLAVALTSHVAILRSLTAHHHSIIGGTRGSDRTEQWPQAEPQIHDTPPKIRAHDTEAEDEDELKLNYEENDSTMDVDTAQRGAAEAPCKGKAAASAMHKRKQSKGRSR
eukprot:jgi/Tetstr1/463846/TSEL_008660.t1